MGSIGVIVDPLDVTQARDLRLRDARPEELDHVAALLGDVYGVFREHFPPEAWERYVGEIVDVYSRVGESELIVAERAGRLVGTIGFYPDASRSALERWPAGWGSIRTLAGVVIHGAVAWVSRWPVNASAARVSVGLERSDCTRHRICRRRLCCTCGWGFAALPSSTSRSARCSPADRWPPETAGWRRRTYWI
jgi:hypothetical protein